MKIFVTVGTTPFDSLIRKMDSVNEKFDITMQIANGSYKPSNHQYIRFTENIEKLYCESDLVVTHAGAGSVFRLLEMGKKILVFPNCERRDLHQLDIAKYLYINNLGVMGDLRSDIESQLKKVHRGIFSKYHKIEFFGSEVIENETFK